VSFSLLQTSLASCRVNRGASWVCAARFGSIAARDADDPLDDYINLGLRLFRRCA
jgi:hypothetical protein